MVAGLKRIGRTQLPALWTLLLVISDPFCLTRSYIPFFVVCCIFQGVTFCPAFKNDGTLARAVACSWIRSFISAASKILTAKINLLRYQFIRSVTILIYLNHYDFLIERFIYRIYISISYCLVYQEVVLIYIL